ncbi:MAG: NAD-dependent epimerase/dehydratase family protein [Chloroflexi bacterium]|nr:NAD-dependent epimerase/dehydratase family protein [Chloroflexota bacterium]
MRELVSKARQVHVVNRSGQAPIPAGVQVVKGDVYDPVSVRDIAAGASIVFQCASPDYTQWVNLFPKMQSAIIDGVAAVGAKLVVAENLYMYGRVSGPITEDLPYNATTRKGEVRARMAEQVMEAHRSGKVRTTSGRASDFYGPYALLGTPGERAFYPAIAGKRVDVLGKLDLPHTFTYIDDFARGLVTLGERDEALGSAWHVPSAPTLTQREIVTMIFEAAGTKPQMGETPALLVKALGLLNPLAREVAEMLYEFEEPFVMSHARFEGAFGNGATPH